MLRWVRLAIGAAIVLVGWLFIAWQNKFHITPPLVFVCLGFLAVVLMVYNLWRTGAAVAMIDDAESRASWAKPVGARTHLEREKKMLLKAIKEAEFDHQMGKLSKADADHMVAVYRARAIELIKALEKDSPGLSVRERIEREVRARLEVDGKTKKKAEADAAVAEGKTKKKADAAEGKKQKKNAAKTEAKTDDAKPEEPKTEAKTDDAKPDEKTEAKPAESAVEAIVAASEPMPAKEATS